MKLRIATRRSPLALAQTRWVAERLRAFHPSLEVEEVQLSTEGDRVLDVPLAKVGGKGLFVSEVEAALLDGRADLAVHSMKDVPESLAEGMELVCTPEREDPRDVLITRDGQDFFDLEAGSRVGTSSLRRAVQLHGARPDLAFAVLRGNVGTRLRKLEEGQYDAIVLASAGLRRLGLSDSVRFVPLSLDLSTPAVGQGALGLEARANDFALRTLLAPLEHAPTRLAIEAERAFLIHLHGSCSTPLAAHARLEESALLLDGMIGSLDGSQLLRGSMQIWIGAHDPPSESIIQAKELGRKLARALREEGADAMIAQAKSEPDPYAFLYSKSG